MSFKRLCACGGRFANRAFLRIHLNSENKGDPRHHEVITSTPRKVDKRKVSDERTTEVRGFTRSKKR